MVMTMICFKLLPRGIVKCVDHEKATLRELVEEIKGYLENSNYLVLVNGRIIENLEYTVSSEDTVILIEEFMGG